LINPTIDCSDKEMHQRNGFKTHGDNLTNFYKNNDQANFIKEVFRPSKLGMYTKDYLGTTKLIRPNEHKPKFDGPGHKSL